MRISKESVALFVLIASSLSYVLVISGADSNKLAWASSRMIYVLWTGGLVAVLFCYATLMLSANKVSFPVSASNLVRHYVAWIAALLAISMLGLFEGLLQGNPIGFALGDTVKYTLLPLGFLVVYLAFRVMKKARLFLQWMAALSVFPGLGVGTVGFFLSYAVVLAGLRNRLLPWLLLLAALILTMSIGKTGILMAPVLLIAALYLLPGFKLRSFVLLGSALAVVFVIVFSSTNWAQSTGGYRKMMYFYKTISHSHLDKSTNQRVQEAKLIWNKFNDEHWHHWITGFGNGAVYHASGFTPGYQKLIDRSYGGMAHHVHINPLFILHQWGLVGIALFVWFFVLLFYSAVQIRRSRCILRTHEGLVATASWFMLISFVFYGLVNPPKNALFYAGMLLGIHVFAIGRLSAMFGLQPPASEPPDEYPGSAVQLPAREPSMRYSHENP